MRKLATLVSVAAVGLFAFNASSAEAQSFTDFDSFTVGISVDGQGGWGASGSWDEEVFDDAGNEVWRVSNASTAGSFGDMPFAPRPGGIVADAVTDPVNSNPGNFAGESSTGANHNGMRSEFDFISATGAPQAGLRITISPDNGQGARQGFVSIDDTGAGFDIVTLVSVKLYDRREGGDSLPYFFGERFARCIRCTSRQPGPSPEIEARALFPSPDSQGVLPGRAGGVAVRIA